MGTVYRLFDRALLREVAMKATDPDAPLEARVGELLLEEAQIAGQLDHPHIVPVYDIGLGAEGTRVQFSMKLVRGKTLTEVLDEVHQRPWDDREVERCLQAILRVCDALAFAHSRGVVHRDVKPDNVMVGTFGQVYLMDWGLAMLDRVPAVTGDRVEERPVTVTSHERRRRADAGMIAGTPDYMAPEQAWGQTAKIDARTDVYGVGGLLYRLLTHHGPNQRSAAGGVGRTLRPTAVEPPEQRAAWPSLPPELCRITMKALAEDPEQRYPSVAALQADLEEFLRGGGWFSTRRYPGGTVIVRQGDPATEGYMIVEGTCAVTKAAGEATYHVRDLGPGDVFGETALLTRDVRSATVTASTDVVVKVVTAEAFEREFAQRSWSGTFVRAIAARFREADEQLSAVRSSR
ncbi:MAG: cyclic nucleotide-binding domain-containing protein [Deltaproteobacteria bacterium]|nr:cyclic nucleotide-binding domain-containing protein [Deltaproteobacteria bacterium]